MMFRYKIGYLITSLIVLVSFGGALYMYQDTALMLKQLKRVDGLVVAIRQIRDSDGALMDAPYIRYRPLYAQKALYFTPNLASSQALKKSDIVSVLYDPKNPSRAMIDRKIWNQYKAIVLFGFGCVVFVIMILSAMINHQRKGSKT